ncbi:MAG: cobalt transporter CbiM [Nitrospirae bacterium]|nr:cobalt transporter CbiM [Nitrospirota bacterium]
MHISEGILSGPVLLSSAVLTASGVAIGLRKMQVHKIPEVAVLTSAFFVISLVHIPVGPASAHLILNGLVGLLMGWMAFPSIFVAITLQALLFQFGGFTTLGANTLTMAVPAVAVYYLFNPLIKRGNNYIALAAAFAAGVCGILFACLLLTTCLFLTTKEFYTVAKVMFIGHTPIMVIEGIVTTFCVSFLRKVKPEILVING